MSVTEEHRQGASLSRSTSTRVKTLLERAADLENQLAIEGKSNEEKAAGLRSHLCEVLSDVLISDPPTGLRHDGTARLWRNCFYSPIGIWRKKISREKRKQGRGLKSLENNYKKFLGEAVTLYDYLIVQYQSKLVPCSQSQDASQQSSPESTSPNEQFYHALVQGLYRLYIHLGDLYRYAESFNKAENCYFNASKLAPGLGNPYNQLAVVSQMKDSNLSCVALYYYFRSLLATHEPFETSNSNLERLFHSNRIYIREHSRDFSPPLFSGGNKKGNLEMQRAQKAAASKSCLAHFVDLHYELFKEPGQEYGGDRLVREKMDGIIKSFDSLVQSSAFSDSLLSKMVLINAFAIYIKERKKVEQGLLVAKDLLFHFGISLSSKLQSSISKGIEKQGKLPSSVRMLMPFCLLCEFVGHFSPGTETSPAMRSFWKEFALVSTQLRKTLDKLAFSLEPSQHFVPKEYEMVKGFQPYTFLFPSYSQGEPYIDPENAVYILDLTLSQSQESDYAICNNLKVRLLRFLNLCDDLSLKAECPIILQGMDVVFMGLNEPSPQMYEHNSDDAEEKGKDGFQESVEVNPLLKPRRSSPPVQTLKHSKVLKPPPGFEGRGTNNHLGSSLQPQDYVKNLGVAIQPSASQQQTSYKFPPQPSHVEQPTQVSLFEIAGRDKFPAVARTPQQFGERGLYTDNPFADDAMRRLPTTCNAILDNTNAPMEDSSLLGTSLFESLFMTDAGARKTENPFVS